MAFKSILNNKVRSILTMLGIIIGVASVIAIVSSIQGTSKLQRLQYEAMGVNRIDVFGYGGRSKDWKDFEEYLDTELADKVSAWSPQIQYYDWQSDGVQYRTKKLSNDSDNNGWTNTVSYTHLDRRAFDDRPCRYDRRKLYRDTEGKL